MMKFQQSMLVTENLPRACAFYTTLLGCRVTLDLGENVTLDGCFSLQQRAWWTRSIGAPQSAIRYGGNDAELYFEESDFDAFAEKLAARTDIQYVTPVHTQPWGQRAVQFYDPDRHIVEVGEQMGAVVRRFLAEGQTAAQIAARMELPPEHVERLKNEYFT